MAKHIKHIALVLLLVIMGSIVLACNPNGTEQKPLSTDGKDNDSSSIYFENQVVHNQIVEGFEGNGIIRSYSELEKFFTDNCVSDDNKAMFNKYNTDYFNDKAIVFCYFWASDGRIKRQLGNVFIDGNTLQIEVMHISPYPITASTLDCYYFFNILQVKKSDITNIADVTVSHEYSYASDNNSVSGKIISIDDASNNNLLSTTDLQSIAYYMGCAGDTSYIPMPKKPETLNSATELNIKQLYLKELQKEYPQATVDDIIINSYYGTYGSCIAVRLSNKLFHCDYLFDDEKEFGGVMFYNYCAAFVSIILL